MAYVQELLEISPAILKLAAPFADSVQPHHWISTPEGDEGSEWCPACGLAKVKELLAEDPDHAGDYFLDGGWRNDSDTTCYCEGCGIRLDAGLTDYGAGEELTHYVCEGIHAFCPEIAYDIFELVNHFDWQSEKANPQDAADCLSLARTFLIGHHYQEVVQPCQWADDGGRVD